MSGLQKQSMPINFGQGLDGKTDPKLVQPGKLLTLENGVFHKGGRIDKRNGYSLLSDVTLDGSVLDHGSGLATFQNEILQYNKQRLYSFSEGASKWLDKGVVVAATVETNQVVNNNHQQTQCDHAINNGIGVYAWKDSRGGIRASVFDETTGTTMLSDVIIDAAGFNVRCLAFDLYIFVFYYKAGAIYTRRLTVSNPIGFDAAFTVSTTVNLAQPLYDVTHTLSSRMLVIHNVEGASELKLIFLSSAPAILTGVLSPITYTELADGCLSFVSNHERRTYCVVYYNAVAGVKSFIINSGGAILGGPTVVDAPGAFPAIRATGYKKRDNSGFQLYWDVSAAVARDVSVHQAQITNAGVVSAVGILVRSVALWTRGFFYEDPNDSLERGFVGVTYDSSLQSSFFVVRNDGALVARMQPGLGAGLGTTREVQNVEAITSTEFSFCLLNKTRIFSENANVLSQVGLARTKIDLDSSDAFNTVELAKNLHIAGGILSMYDGLSVVEHGFLLYPEDVTASQVAGTHLQDGTYQFSVVYEWKDNQGNIHRSAPSVPVTLVVTGGPKDGQLVIPTLRLTAKRGDRVNVAMQVYRTEKDGTVLYRDSSISSPLFNGVAVNSVTYTTLLTDAQIVSNDILYTVGGELDNIAPPASRFISVFKNRIFLAGLEDPNQTWYSKINSISAPVEFAAELTQNIDPQGDSLTAIGVLDDKVVYFKKDRFYITYGDGPNNAGGDTEFAQPQFVTADVGCTSSGSVVRVPDGLMFKSQKGLYKLNSSLQTEYVGAPVENFNHLAVTSAVLKSDVNQVRFLTSDGDALVYDYFFGQWSTFTNHKSFDSLIWNSKFVLLRTDGNVYYENPDVFTDNLVGYSMKIGTGWLSFDSVVGFQRVYDLAFLGEYKSPHVLRCQIGYDFSTAFAPPIIFSPDTAIPISHYGDDATYGDSEAYGGSNSSYRWKASLTQQKCQSVRFLFEDLVTAATAGSQESFTITSIGLEVGIKGHLGRMKESQSIGAQA